MQEKKGFTLKTKAQGFTLIELMVAISIVAILATVGFTTYTQSQLRARDLKRKQDLRAIAAALDLYYQANNRYPCTTTGLGSNASAQNWLTDSSGCGNATTSSFDSRFIINMPKDPIGNTTAYADNSDTYTYYYITPNVTNGAGTTCPAASGGTGNTQYYVLKAHLENPNDPERCELKQYMLCDNTYLCGGTPTNSQKRIFAITSI